MDAKPHTRQWYYAHGFDVVRCLRVLSALSLLYTTSGVAHGVGFLCCGTGIYGDISRMEMAALFPPLGGNVCFHLVA